MNKNLIHPVFLIKKVNIWNLELMALKNIFNEWLLTSYKNEFMNLLFTEDSIFSPTYKKSSPFIQRGHSVDTCPGSPITSKENNCQINTLLMIIHSGSVLGK